MPQPGATALDVLIAGAGPTGLMLALELLAQGMRVRLIDAAPERSPHSRALAVQARTLELLAAHRLADPLVARGRRTAGARLFVGGREAVDVRLGDVGAEDTRFPFVLFVSQAETCALLEEEVVRRGGRVERPLRLTGFAEQESGVLATLADGAGREEKVQARFLAGCDGAHSAVRKAAGIGFQGGRYPEDFILADAALDWKGPSHRISFFFGDPGFAAIFPLRGGLYRILASPGGAPPAASGGKGSEPLPAGGAGAEPPPPTLDELQREVERVAGLPLRIEEPRWLSRFRVHHRMADHYRRGRAFLLGDAAHIHSPAGGQGMNTGMQDAVNLAWKLSLVLRDQARPELLDSYEAERMPVGRKLLRSTDRAFSFVASRNRPLVFARNLLAPRALRLLLEPVAVHAWVFRFVSQLAIEYSGSSIVEERAGGPGLQGLVAGFRAPDAPLNSARGGAATSVHGQGAGPGHTLWIFAGQEESDLARLAAAAAEAAAGCAAPIDVRLVCPEAEREGAPEGALLDFGGTARSRFGLRAAGGHALVRPDGYIAFREEGHDFGALVRYLHRLYPRG